MKQTADEEAPARILAIEFVCFLSCLLSFFLSFSLALFLFFSFFPPTFSIFSRSNAHSHTNKGVDFQKGLFVRFNMARDEKFAKDLVRSTCSKSNNGGGRDAERPKADRYMAVCFTRFVDYRLMFDSGRSFSLEYDLIRSPYSGAHNPPAVLKIPRILASPTSRSASVLYPLSLR